MQVYFNHPVLENRAWSMKWRMRYSPSHSMLETLQRTRMAASLFHLRTKKKKLFVPVQAPIDRALPSFFAALFESVEELSDLSLSNQPLCSDWRTHLLQPDVRSTLYDHAATQFEGFRKTINADFAFDNARAKLKSLLTRIRDPNPRRT